MAQKIAIVIAKDRNPRPEQEALVDQLVRGLERRPELDVTVMPHLYDLAPDGPGVRFLRTLAGELIVLSWLYPRSTYWVLEAHGIRGRLGRTSSLEEDSDEPAERPGRRPALPDRTLWCFDLRRFERAEDCLAEIARLAGALAGDSAGAGLEPAADRTAGPDGGARLLLESTRPRWYPVVDFDRCTACLECLNFCLFGVFGLDEASAPTIEQPDACRNGCPACARICPAGAIMFPQHGDPAIAGDPALSPAGLKLDLSQLFGGVMPADLAARERQRALAEQAGPQVPAAPSPAQGQPPPGSQGSAGADDPLDRLVDGLENMDL